MLVQRDWRCSNCWTSSNGRPQAKASSTSLRQKMLDRRTDVGPIGPSPGMCAEPVVAGRRWTASSAPVLLGAQQSGQVGGVFRGCGGGLGGRLRGLVEVLVVDSVHRFAVPVGGGLRGEGETDVVQSLEQHDRDVMGAVLSIGRDPTGEAVSVGLNRPLSTWSCPFGSWIGSSVSVRGACQWARIYASTASRPTCITLGVAQPDRRPHLPPVRRVGGSDARCARGAVAHRAGS